MKRTIHFVPCRFTYAQHPEQLSIGQVILRPTQTFLRFIQPHIQRSIVGMGGGSGAQKRLDDVQSYFAAFTWCAEIAILEDDSVESERRALWAARSAINLLRVVSDHRTMSRAGVAGSRLDQLDTQARITVSEQGGLGFSYRQGSTAPVAFDEGWHKCLEGAGPAELLRAFSAALDHVLDPSECHPIAERCVEALNLAGDAMSEEHHASKIAKAMIALERLLLFSETSPKEKWTTHRAAALQCWAFDGTNFSEVLVAGKRYYQLRSDLFHGRVSHFDKRLLDEAEPCVRYALNTIEAAMIWFNVQGVMHQSPTDQQVDASFASLSDEVRNATKRAKSRMAPDQQGETQ